MSITSFIVRTMFRRNDEKRDAGLTTPETVRRFDNISYGPDRKWNLLDVYLPADAEAMNAACANNEEGGSDASGSGAAPHISGAEATGTTPLPVIISVHGGGWVYGDKERYQYYCMSLAEHGFALVNYTYRLAPEHKYPAPLEDTDMVFSWVHEHADEYGFDTGNIFAVGDSAGANILGLYCCICTSPEYAKNYRIKSATGAADISDRAFPDRTRSGSASSGGGCDSDYEFHACPDYCPKAVALNCGVYHQDKSPKKDLTQLLMANLMPRKGTDEEFHLICVDEHVTADFPPAFIMTAEGDFLREQAQPFHEKLQSLGVSSEYHFYGGPGNELGHVFHCNIRLPEAQQCNREECEFFRENMTRS